MQSCVSLRAPAAQGLPFSTRRYPPPPCAGTRPVKQTENVRRLFPTDFLDATLLFYGGFPAVRRGTYFPQPIVLSMELSYGSVSLICSSLGVFYGELSFPPHFKRPSRVAPPPPVLRCLKQLFPSPEAPSFISRSSPAGFLFHCQLTPVPGPARFPARLLTQPSFPIPQIGNPLSWPATPFSPLLLYLMSSFRFAARMHRALSAFFLWLISLHVFHLQLYSGGKETCFCQEWWLPLPPTFVTLMNRSVPAPSVWTKRSRPKTCRQKIRL